ncbi:hypothetical protein [Hydrogenophaga sp.]|uniref:hypothetical protein n=1 Tax=Hydrogenophaga sp. TaxID=1904254 RepID=UPI0027252213|nr:hypothetical protein [Hydrogenophaga sp.]MDO9437319.1 hypothetical protein [Hydrogenophaga sp.]
MSINTGTAQSKAAPNNLLDTSDDNQTLEKNELPRVTGGFRMPRVVQRLKEHVIEATTSQKVRNAQDRAAELKNMEAHLNNTLAVMGAPVKDAKTVQKALDDLVEALQPVVKRYAEKSDLIRKLCGAHLRVALPKLGNTFLVELQKYLNLHGMTTSIEVNLVLQQIGLSVGADVLRRLVIDPTNPNVGIGLDLDLRDVPNALKNLPEGELHKLVNLAAHLVEKAEDQYVSTNGQVSGTSFTKTQLKQARALIAFTAAQLASAKKMVAAATPYTVSKMSLDDLTALKSAVDLLRGNSEFDSPEKRTTLKPLINARIALETANEMGMNETNPNWKLKLLMEAFVEAPIYAREYAKLSKGKPNFQRLDGWAGPFCAGGLVNVDEHILEAASKDMKKRMKASPSDTRSLLLQVSILAELLRRKIDVMESAAKAEDDVLKENIKKRHDICIEVSIRAEKLVAIFKSSIEEGVEVPGTAFTLKTLQAIQRRADALYSIYGRRVAFERMTHQEQLDFAAAIDELKENPGTGGPSPAYLKRLSDELFLSNPRPAETS